MRVFVAILLCSIFLFSSVSILFKYCLLQSLLPHFESHETFQFSHGKGQKGKKVEILYKQTNTLTKYARGWAGWRGARMGGDDNGGEERKKVAAVSERE